MRIAILISGRGSNMLSLAAHAKRPESNIEIVAVISNRPHAEGLKAAQSEGLETHCIDHKDFASREAFDASLDKTLRACRAELVCSAGFMRILTDGFVREWQGKLLNIHPSLLPAFKGIKVHEQALAAGVAFSGCTVHYVVPELDSGPIIGQAVVPVRSDDTPETLAKRVLTKEHKLYPACLDLVVSGQVRLIENKAQFVGSAGPIALAQD